MTEILLTIATAITIITVVMMTMSAKKGMAVRTAIPNLGLNPSWKRPILLISSVLLVATLVFVFAEKLSATFWILTLLGLLVSATIMPKKWSSIAYATTGLLALLLIGIGFSTFINWSVDTTRRGINYGDWSEPQGYVRTIANGTVKMKRNQEEQFYVVGSVKLTNNNEYTCLNIGPSGKFHIESTNGFRTTYITAISGQKEMAFVKVKPQSECR